MARIIGDDTADLGEVTTGIVLLRYFAPTLDDTDDDSLRFFSQILNLDVEQPQVLTGRERRRR